MILAEIFDLHRGKEGNLLPILHNVQKQFGHVSEDSVREIAQELNLTRAEVHGVVSFYHDFKPAPEARPIVKLCRAEACQARGVGGLLAVAEGQQRVKIEPVYCLGLCAVGPAAMVAGRVHARLTTESFAQLLKSV